MRSSLPVLHDVQLESAKSRTAASITFVRFRSSSYPKRGPWHCSTPDMARDCVTAAHEGSSSPEGHGFFNTASFRSLRAHSMTPDPRLLSLCPRKLSLGIHSAWTSGRSRSPRGELRDLQPRGEDKGPELARSQVPVAIDRTLTLAQLGLAAAMRSSPWRARLQTRWTRVAQRRCGVGTALRRRKDSA
jgi:hypothetical protein